MGVKGRHAQAGAHGRREDKTDEKHGGHARVRQAGAAIPVAIMTMAVILIGAWFMPASWIPVTRTTVQCTVTSGGTLRVHTSDCGTFYYRGHADLIAGKRYAVTRSGPIAWQFAPLNGPVGE